MEVLKKTEEENDMTTTQFIPSVQMSTYLVAFVVSPMKSNCKKDDKNRPHCIYVEERFSNWTQVALETSIKAFKYFEDLLQIDYPLSKIDHVGIPKLYLYPSAMENWGLITYRIELLVGHSPDVSTIMHEIAHQWFGNLVRMI